MVLLMKLCWAPARKELRYRHCPRRRTSGSGTEQQAVREVCYSKLPSLENISPIKELKTNFINKVFLKNNTPQVMGTGLEVCNLLL